jgi:hypothetical protein
MSCLADEHSLRELVAVFDNALYRKVGAIAFSTVSRIQDRILAARADLMGLYSAKLDADQHAKLTSAHGHLKEADDLLRGLDPFAAKPTEVSE